MAKRFEQMEHLLDNFEWNGVKVLQEVVDAMSDSEFNEIFHQGNQLLTRTYLSGV